MHEINNINQCLLIDRVRHAIRVGKNYNTQIQIIIIWDPILRIETIEEYASLEKRPWATFLLSNINLARPHVGCCTVATFWATYSVSDVGSAPRKPASALPSEPLKIAWWARSAQVPDRWHNASTINHAEYLQGGIFLPWLQREKKTQQLLSKLVITTVEIVITTE